MRSHFILTLRVPNPLFWWVTRHARRAERESLARIEQFKKYMLADVKEHREPIRKTTLGLRASDRAPLAPFGWGGVPQGGTFSDMWKTPRDPKEVLDIEPEQVIVRV